MPTTEILTVTASDDLVVTRDVEPVDVHEDHQGRWEIVVRPPPTGVLIEFQAATGVLFQNPSYRSRTAMPRWLSWILSSPTGFVLQVSPRTKDEARRWEFWIEYQIVGEDRPPARRRVDPIIVCDPIT
ncbi:MAG: hypothetical protein AAGN46_12565 [Acidobacteriota bacterium]